MKLIAIVMLLAGRASVRMPSDSTTIIGEHGTMIVIAEEIGACDDLREYVSIDFGCARVEKLQVVRSGAAYGAAPQLPRLIGRRSLVYAAYAVANRGPTIALRFYIDQDGYDHAAEWARVARDVAQTLELYPTATAPCRCAAGSSAAR